MMNDLYRDMTGSVYRFHAGTRCKGQTCVLHNPSQHSMMGFAALVRADKSYLVERICPHGVGHPDPDSLAYFIATDNAWIGVHGCDGCCKPLEEGNERLTARKIDHPETQRERREESTRRIPDYW